MDHPMIDRTLRTGYPKPQPKPKPVTHKDGEYWDPIEWIKKAPLEEDACKHA